MRPRITLTFCSPDRYLKFSGRGFDYAQNDLSVFSHWTNKGFISVEKRLLSTPLQPAAEGSQETYSAEKGHYDGVTVWVLGRVS